MMKIKQMLSENLATIGHPEIADFHAFASVRVKAYRMHVIYRNIEISQGKILAI